MVTRTLTASDFDAVHAGFLDAFSDYVVKLSPTKEQLLEMLTRRGWVPEASVGEFEGERIVAFTLNGIDGESGYDSGTGVAPSHRRRGLAQLMMERSFELLREGGCRRYVLEVIDANAPAIELYQSLGFEVTRGLQCWTFESQSPAVAESQSASWETSRPCDSEADFDLIPAWQNTTASVNRARDPHVAFGDENGCAIVFPGNGDVPQLSVRRDARRRGVGTRLLHEAARIAGKPLRIMNVDERAEGVARFLEAAGAKRTVRQLEMARNF